VIAPSGPVIANAVEMEIEAALAGLGVIRTFEELLAPGIAEGRLVRILSEWDSEFSGPFLYYPSRRHMPAPLRAFVDFVRVEQRKSA
jgi:DNA-binding transcriptional LysR family regulator